MNFSKRSESNLKTCHKDLQKIASEAIRVSRIDFGISEGYRSVEKQQEYFNQGKSKVDGIKIKGKHNYNPSMAFDIYAYVGGKAVWETKHLCYLGGMIVGIAEMLLAKGEITHKLRWGGNWDMDGEIISDQTFQDLPHFELREI
jgi:peptidoglycan L-alanyl-D-glutamate endopeptidase CwlK